MLIMRQNGQQEISQDSLNLKFGSKSHEIDAATLGHVLLSLSTIAQIANDTANPDTTLDIKVKANKTGSFIAELVILVEAVVPALPILPHLLTADNFKSAGEIAKTVGELLKIKKELKGEKPESLEKNKQADGRYIFQNDGDVSVYNAETVNLYISRPEIGREATRIGSTLESDDEITDFEMSDSEGQVQFLADRPAFAMLATGQIETEYEAQERIVTRREQLNVVSFSLVPELVWRFIYLGNRIAAKITDPDFHAKITNRAMSFGSGDILDVDLRIAQTWDETIKAYIDTKHYEISVVHRLISGNTAEMDFSDNEA